MRVASIEVTVVEEVEEIKVGKEMIVVLEEKEEKGERKK